MLGWGTPPLFIRSDPLWISVTSAVDRKTNVPLTPEISNLPSRHQRLQRPSRPPPDDPEGSEVARCAIGPCVHTEVAVSSSGVTLICVLHQTLGSSV